MAQDKANPKMAVWNQVSTTPVQYTETVHFDGRDITQIDGMYVVMRATELFGPIGKGWGFDIIEDRFDKGAPLLDKNGEVMAWELMHTLLLKLWYVHAGKRCYSTQYGHTPFVRKGQYGPYTDFDACKKSLTDAIKKCLSLAGFCADVYLGMFDDPIYVEGLALHLMYQKIMQQARAKAVVVKFNPDDVEARINEAYEERKAELAKESNGA